MIAAGIVYGIIITLMIQGTFKVIRKIVRRRRAKLIAAVTKSVTMSLGVETQRILADTNARMATHAAK